MQITFRDYQTDIISKGSEVLKKLRIIYLAMEVRTGKTLTALGICQNMNAKNVLFITKKKAISSIKNDYKLLYPDYLLEVVNYESVHKVDFKKFDIIICDEAHTLGAYPKPSLRTKRLKQLIGKKYLIMLSGTPTPESYSQIYHQFWISEFSPFEEKSFYKWSHNYVNIVKKKINGYDINDYKNANEKLIRQKTNKYVITYTQKEAGFTSKVEESILYVNMKPTTYSLVNKLKKDLVFEGKNGGVILGDTAVKLMQKTHQIYSGTVKLEDGSSVILDTSKADFIKSKFSKLKIAIFYKFKAELELLQRIYGPELTTDLDDFNTSNKNIALQIVSGREGVKLSNADYLVFFNIDFSATSYFQAKDRMTTKERLINKVFWIFSKGGLEDKIYKTVQGKKNFTTKHFERENIPIQVNQRI